MSTRGSLLVSTKSAAAGRKTIITVCSVLFILLGIVFLFLPWVDITGNAIFGYIVSAICICYGVFNLVVAFLGGKSYCSVYENAVVGMTCLSKNNPNAPMQNFELRYDEIMNVTNTGKNILIYTQYATYDVLALKNCAEATQEIRTRMTGRK